MVSHGSSRLLDCHGNLQVVFSAMMVSATDFEYLYNLLSAIGSSSCTELPRLASPILSQTSPLMAPSFEVRTDNLVHTPPAGSMNPLRIYHLFYLIRVNAGPPLAAPALRKRPLQRQHAIIIYLDEIVPTLVSTSLDNPETGVIGGFGSAVLSEPSGASNSGPDTNNYISSFHGRYRDSSA
jgi:hypothetical protein